MVSINKNNIDNIVQLINTELNKNRNISLKKVLDKLQLNKAVLEKQLKNNNYEYSVDERQYYKQLKIDENLEKDIEITKDEVKEIRELINMKNDLKTLIQKYNNSTNNILSIDRTKFEGDIKTRLVKTYSNVNEEWIKFCKKHEQYKMQDLYSQALLEFMNKYN